MRNEWYKRCQDFLVVWNDLCREMKLRNMNLMNYPILKISDYLMSGYPAQKDMVNPRSYQRINVDMLHYCVER